MGGAGTSAVVLGQLTTSKKGRLDDCAWSAADSPIATAIMPTPAAPTTAIKYPKNIFFITPWITITLREEGGN